MACGGNISGLGCDGFVSHGDQHEGCAPINGRGIVVIAIHALVQTVRARKDKSDDDLSLCTGWSVIAPPREEKKRRCFARGAVTLPK